MSKLGSQWLKLYGVGPGRYLVINLCLLTARFGFCNKTVRQEIRARKTGEGMCGSEKEKEEEEEEEEVEAKAGEICAE